MLGVGAAGQRARTRADGKQAGGLAVHQLHAIGFGDVDAADALELQQLAFDHDLGEPDQQVENLKLALAQGDLECLHVEPVARQDAGVVAPLHVGRRPAAPGLGGIDHIVVQEGGGVNQLDHRAQLDGGGVRRRRPAWRRAGAGTGAGVFRRSIAGTGRWR